jgi:hypothetical protein
MHHKPKPTDNHDLSIWSKRSPHVIGHAIASANKFAQQLRWWKCSDTKQNLSNECGHVSSDLGKMLGKLTQLNGQHA